MIHLLSTQPLVGRLGWALVHFLWQGALIACLYLMARTLFTRPESARIRYTLSCAMLAAMIMAPVVTLVKNRPPTPASAITRIAGAFSARPVPGPHSGSIPFEALPTTAPVAPAVDAMTWLVAVWLIGSLVLSIRLIGGCVVAARFRSQRVTAPPLEWRNALDSLITRTRLSLPVRLLVSGFVQTPVVVGWLKPAILLPASAVTGLAPEHIQALLAHELAHIRRHDYLVNVLQRVTETLLFYHPAVWWLSRQIDAEREACCDDIAVGLTGDTLTYVSALASLESQRPEHLAPLLAANGGSLQHRIARLVSQSPAPTYGLPVAGLLTAGMLMGLAVCGLMAQAMDARPAFEVASLKPDKSQTGVDRIKRTGGSWIIENVSLKRLIGMAYGVADGRDYLLKGPDWLDTENFDIAAKFPPQTSDEQVLIMLQRLLDERFKLKLHREPHEFSVYALVVDKRGAKLRPVAHPGPSYRFSARGGHAVGMSVSMAQFADRLSRETVQIGRQVVDFTGLEGKFDLTLDWNPEGDRPENPGAASDRPSIFVALQQQLGLRLEPRKVSLDVTVVDAAVKVPLEN
jgi:uncharacterized protein (TIGR03435 family)